MTVARILVLVLAAATTAEAGPLADAIRRHDQAAVTALRAQLPGDAATRCTLGTVYARRADLSRAMLYLDGCADATLPDDIASDVTRAVRETKKLVRASELAELQVLSKPDGLAATVDALPDEPLTTPATVWIAAGTHTVRATTADGTTISASTTAKPYSRALVMLAAPVHTAVTPRTQSVNFEEEGAATEQSSGPPPDIKRPSMIRGKLLGIAGPRFGPELDDPFAPRASSSSRPWFGVRLGGGVFDDGATTAAYRPSVAAAARFTLTPALFLAARLDWSRRGGAASSIDTAGASLGAGTTLVDHASISLAAIAQLRADLRFADTRAMASVRRAGASVAASVELAFPSTPLTAGLRFEQGLTELVDGARDRALLVELGVDWR